MNDHEICDQDFPLFILSDAAANIKEQEGGDKSESYPQIPGITL